MARAPIMAIQPTGEEVALAEVVTAPPAVEEQAALPAVQENAAALPATASILPLIGLFGLMALLAAFATRTAAKRLQ